MKLVVVLFNLLLCAPSCISARQVFSKNGLTVGATRGSRLKLAMSSNGNEILRGKLGLALPNVAVLRKSANCGPTAGEADVCYEWGDYAHLRLTAPTGPHNCARVEWSTRFGRRLEDCFYLQPDVHWYGGGETKIQTWPIETVRRQEGPFVTGDYIEPTKRTTNYGGVVETYWLTSSGVAIHVDEDTPLFMSWNTTRPGQVCFVAQDRPPFTERKEVRLKYDLCVPRAGENMKDVHMRALRRYYSIPSALPDMEMLKKPFWSTWAEYKESINQTLVLEMARRMVQEGYTNNSHVEIDDNWESCYGEAEFNTTKFPDPAGMIRELAELGIKRVTLWVHPFINTECPSFDVAVKRSYFVEDTLFKHGLTRWWQGNSSILIDFSNENAVTWWTSRLQKLQNQYNITSFKFDAGESFWLPPSCKLTKGDGNFLPNVLTTKYVEAVSSFGGMVETRAAHRNQGLSFFIRMMDKDSRWDYENGLQSLIPTLLLFSVLGYSFVLPDMIGGNEYVWEVASNELYIRWAQANVFMPAWQFSILPWDKDPTGVRDRAVKAAVRLRTAHGDDIIAAAKQTLVDGSPMNRPMWWVDPTDPQTFTISDQFMLGDNILVAPVIEEGAVSRDIYLPQGTWQSNSATGPSNFTGPMWLRKWPAPIEVLPFFRRVA